MKILRYTLSFDFHAFEDFQSQVLTMPIGAKILSVQTVQNKIALWASVPDEEDIKIIARLFNNNETEQRHFKIVLTNSPFEADTGATLNYIGTVAIYPYEHVVMELHVFELLR